MMRPPRKLPSASSHLGHATGLLIFLFAAITAPLAATRHGWMVDDAFITFRFVENFLHGWGWTWNPGEAPIEGTSNMLYSLLLAFIGKLGLPYRPISIWLNPIWAIVIMYLAFLMVRKFTGRVSPFCALPALLLAFNPSFSFWIGGGLETIFYTMLLTLAAWRATLLVERPTRARAVWLGLTLAMMAATRPEGLILSASFVMIMTIYLRINASSVMDRRAERIDWLLALAWLLPVLGFLTWRRAYFGDWLPNTYYAKVHAGVAQMVGGLDYVWRYFNDVDSWFTPALILLLLPFWSRPLMPPSALLVVALGLIVYVGGEGMPYARFMLFVTPLLYVLLAVLLDRFADALAAMKPDAIARRLTPCALVLLVVLHVHQLYRRDTLRFAPARLRDVPRALAAGDWPLMGKKDCDPRWAASEFMRRNLPRGATIAALAIGRFGDYSKLRVHDRLGLCDRTISRAGDSVSINIYGRYNVRLTLAEKPDILLIGNDPAQTFQCPAADWDELAQAWAPLGLWAGDCELLHSPEVRQAYFPEIIEVAPGVWLHLLRRRDHPWPAGVEQHVVQRITDEKGPA